MYQLMYVRVLHVYQGAYTLKMDFLRRKLSKSDLQVFTLCVNLMKGH
jgi:hypothetical protein